MNTYVALNLQLSFTFFFEVVCKSYHVRSKQDLL